MDNVIDFKEKVKELQEESEEESEFLQEDLLNLDDLSIEELETFILDSLSDMDPSDIDVDQYFMDLLDTEQTVVFSLDDMFEKELVFDFEEDD